MSSAVFGLVGVLLGSLATSILTITGRGWRLAESRSPGMSSTNEIAKPRATLSSGTAFWPCRLRSQT